MCSQLRITDWTLADNLWFDSFFDFVAIYILYCLFIVYFVAIYIYIVLFV